MKLKILIAVYIDTIQQHLIYQYICSDHAYSVFVEKCSQKLMVTQLPVDSMDNTLRAERPVLGQRAIIKLVYMFF